jgi:hypothetical protein
MKQTQETMNFWESQRVSPKKEIITSSDIPERMISLLVMIRIFSLRFIAV